MRVKTSVLRGQIAELQDLSNVIKDKGITPNMSMDQMFAKLGIRQHSAIYTLVKIPHLKGIKGRPNTLDSKKKRFFLDKSIQDLPQVENAIWRNRVLCHEIAHVIDETPEIMIFPDDAEATLEDLRQSNPYIQSIQKHYRRLYPLLEEPVDCLAAAIMFRNQRKYYDTLNKYSMDFRKVSRALRTPLDCTIKWALIHPLPLSFGYIKYNIDTCKMEDQYIPDTSFEFASGITNQLRNKHNITLPSIQNCLKDERDTKAPCDEFYIFSFYEKANRVMDCDAKIIVVIMNRNLRVMLSD